VGAGGSLGPGGGAADSLSQSFAEAEAEAEEDAKEKEEGQEEEGQEEFQRLLDMPLDVFPAAETMDAGAEPAVVLSHLLQAKAELALALSRGLVREGLQLSRGDISNRGLVYHADLPAPEPEPVPVPVPVPEGEEKGGGDGAEEGSLLGERRASHASSITEGGPPPTTGTTGTTGAGTGAQGKWVKMDRAFQEARRLFERSVAVLSESRLRAAQHTAVDRTQRQVVDTPGYTDEQTGEEGPPVMRAELTETPVELSPFDISLARSTQAAYADRMRLVAEGTPSLKKVAASSIGALRSQYGVNLNAARGTKAHQKERVDAREYVPSMHDLHTLKAEVLPLVNSSGRDEVALWIEWALSATQGLGMGLLGLSFNMPVSRADALKEKAAEAARAEKNAAAESASLASGSVTQATGAGAGDDVSMDTMAQGSVFQNLGPGSTIGNKDAFPSVKPSARTAEPFLKEVRGRLSEVEALLSQRYDGNESKYKPGAKELRLLVNAALARVNVQVKNKRDAELAVELMEELSSSMTQRTQNHDPLYVSLAARYRLELEECKVPVGQSDEAQNHSLVGLLGFAKAYVKAVEAIPDCPDGVGVRRDAYKKCINYYSSLASAPLTEKEKPVTEAGTMDVLMCFSDAEIEEKEEQGDMAFLRTFGKCRALQLLKRVRKLARK
jgi:hypothetical protein